MIRHRPFGRGHPYVVDPDQRFPVRPFTGVGFDLGITTEAGARGVYVEFGEQRKPMTLIGDAVPRESPDWGSAAVAANGHLAATAALAPEAGRLAWTFRHHGLAEGERLTYRFTTETDTSGWFEVAACSWSVRGGNVKVEGPTACGPREVAWLGDGESVYAARFALPLGPQDRVVGFGERFDALDQRGSRLETVVYDQYKGQGGRSYLPMPFAIVAGGGFGFYVATGHRVRFDVGAGDSDLLQVEVNLEPGEQAPTIPLRLYEGSPAEILVAFLSDIGVPDEPPPWIYRLWMSSNEWNTQERLLAELDRSLTENIPVGVVVAEAWSDELTFTKFDEERWPDPKACVEAIHERGAKILLWQIPLVKREAADDVAAMIEQGFCVRDDVGEPYGNPGGWFEDALLLDVTNDDAVRWWTERRRHLVSEIGVDGFKTDGGEHAWSPAVRYADGTRGGQTNNRYPVLYARAYHELLRSCGRSAVTFSRAGYTGSQLYPAHWAGDQDSTWESLRSCITAGLGAGACGIFFWSFDLGGFSGPLPSPELYLRSAAVAALCPIMQYHSEFNFHRQPSRDRTPWNVAAQSGDESVLPVFRSFVQTRERLVPYLTEQGRASIRQRRPLMRALFFESDDERLWSFPYEYLLGDALLVAPVVSSGVSMRELFVPRGEWVDPTSDETHIGPGVVEVDCRLDQLPILVDSRRADELVSLFDPIPVEV